MLHFIWVNEFKFHSRVGDLLEVKLECQEEELTELQFYEIQHPHNSSVSLVQNSVYNNIHKNLTNYACLFADIIYCSNLGSINVQVFLKEVFHAHHHIYWSILWNSYTIENNSFLFEYILNVNDSCNAQMNFQHHYFSVTWSFRNLIRWFVAQETVLIIITVENSFAALYFCGNFFYIFDEYEVQKNSIYLIYKTF